MATITKSSFNAGAISKQLYHRVDLPHHPYSCKKIHNAIVLENGAIARRPGTTYATSGDYPFESLKLFRFSLSEVYVLAFGEKSLRVISTGGTVLASIAAPWSSAEAVDISTAQLNDVIWVAHPAHDVRQIIRYSASIWAIVDVPATAGKPAQEVANTDPALTVYTVTASGGWAPNFVINSSVAIFASGDVGKYFFIYHVNYWRRYVITGFLSTSSVEATQENYRLGDTPENVPVTIPWAFQKAGPEGEIRFGGLVSNVFFYQDRLCFSASPGKPRTIFMSATGVYNDFVPPSPLTDDGALELQLTAGKDGTPAYWAVEMKYLLVNSGSSLLWLSSASGSGAITPTSKQASVGSYLSLSAIEPAKTSSEVIVVGSDKRTLYAVSVRTDTSEFPSIKLTASYPDMFSKGIVLPYSLFLEETIKQIDFQSSPTPIIWVLTEEGNLYGCSYNPSLQLLAWHTHSLDTDTGGIGTLGIGSAYIGSICVVPGPAGDHLWMAVNRGVGNNSIEFMEFPTDPGNTLQRVVDGPSNHPFTHEITPIMPVYTDSKGVPEGDSIRVKAVNLSFATTPSYTVETQAGSQDITVDYLFSGNTGDINLGTLIDDDADVTIKGITGPCVLTAVRYEVEVQ